MGDEGCAEASTMGDGKGGTEKKIGKYDTFAECIAAVKDQQPTANGVTWGKGKSGQCYAEFGQTSTKASTVWQNCVIAATPATPAETPATPATDSGTDSGSDSGTDSGTDSSADLDEGCAEASTMGDGKGGTEKK